jgi:hypothetical protein
MQFQGTQFQPYAIFKSKKTDDNIFETRPDIFLAGMKAQ